VGDRDAVLRHGLVRGGQEHQARARLTSQEQGERLPELPQAQGGALRRRCQEGARRGQEEEGRGVQEDHPPAPSTDSNVGHRPPDRVLGAQVARGVRDHGQRHDRGDQEVGGLVQRARRQEEGQGQEAQAQQRGLSPQPLPTSARS